MADTNTFTQRGNTAVSAGATTATLTWTQAFVNTPFQATAQVFSYNDPDTPYVISATVYDVTTEGASVALSAEIPDDGNSYYIGWTASANQPTPSSNDCCSDNGCCGASVNVATSFPSPVVGAYLFSGAQGQAGPLAFYRGTYDSDEIYYQTANRVDVVEYAGYLWRTNNVAKNDTDSWGTPTIGAGDWLNIGTGTPGGYNSLSSTINITGNSTISPASANHTEKISVSGSAGNRIFAVAIAGRVAGDRCWLNFTLAATASIVIYVRNNVVSGTQLLPTEIYPSNAYTTDGTVLSLSVALVFNGTAWTYDTSKAPA
jgi:hypothetical protein